MQTLLVVAAGFAWAVGSVLTKRYGPLEPLKLMAWMSLFTMPQVMAMVEHGQLASLQAASLTAWRAGRTAHTGRADPGVTPAGARTVVLSSAFARASIVPPDIAAKLDQEIAAALREPETQERLAKIGLVVVASAQDALTERLQRDVPKWGKAVKDSGAVAD